MWQLLPTLHACVSVGRLVLLDVRADRYLTFPSQLGRITLDWLDAEPGVAPPERLITALEHARLLQASDPPPSNARRTAIAIPQTLRVAAPRRATPRDIASVSATVLQCWTLLRVRRFASVIAGIDRTDCQCDDATIETRAHRFLAARPYLPVARNCLLDSLALDRWLQHSQHGRTLVFGVMATPFGAHCWLQSRDAILNDTYDRVSRFTPILAI